jgi:hypothetical protein
MYDGAESAESHEPHQLNADSVTIQRLQALVCSELDSCSIVYGSARASYLQALYRLLNESVQVCLSANCSVPIASLHFEAARCCQTLGVRNLPF